MDYPNFKQLINYFGKDAVQKGTFKEYKEGQDHWTNAQGSLRVGFPSALGCLVILLDREGYGISSHHADTLKDAMELANKAIISKAYYSQTEEN